MPLPSLPLSLRLSLFYTAYFLVIGIQLPFWPVWLESRGMTPAEIGLILSVSLWVRIVTIPVAGVVVDRTGNRRGALIVLSASSLAASLIYPPIDGFWPILLVTVLVSAFFSPVMNLGDNLTLLIARANRLDYGRMRLWGSISFIAAAGLGGVTAAAQGPESVLYLLIGGIALTAAAACLLPKPPPKPAPSPLAGTAGRGRVMVLMTDPAFLLFLGATAAIQSSHAVYYAFGTLHWRELGHSEAMIGWLWAEGVIAEILLFAFGTALGARLSPARLLMLAGVAGLVRWTGTAVAETVPALAVLQVLHALTFGAAHLAAMQYIARAIPVDRSATAQALYGALATGMCTALAMILAGAAYDRLHAGAYFTMAAMAAVGVCLALLLTMRERAEPLPADA